jgi:dTDP-4-dehydrorhamnose 3,5-epimerase
MTFHAETTDLPGVMLLRTRSADDDRGSFTRLGCVSTLERLGVSFTARQVSLSRTPRAGTLRGLHFQRPPSAETKIVHCIAGTVFDVVLDLRADSPGFRRSLCMELSAERGVGLLIPPGCAHGLLTLSDDVSILYQIDHDYDPAAASGVRWNDPVFAIPWPMPPSKISERDCAWPDFVT